MSRQHTSAVIAILLISVISSNSAYAKRFGFRKARAKRNACPPTVVQPASCQPACASCSTCSRTAQAQLVAPCSTCQTAAIQRTVCPTMAVVISPCQPRVIAMGAACPCQSQMLSGPHGTLQHLPSNAVISGGSNPQVFLRQPDGSLVPASPYSLSGYAIPPASARSTPRMQVPNPCEEEFLRCCENGGPNCIENYMACTDLSGEPVLHSACPPGGPIGRSSLNR